MPPPHVCCFLLTPVLCPFVPQNFPLSQSDLGLLRLVYRSPVCGSGTTFFLVSIDISSSHRDGCSKMEFFFPPLRRLLFFLFPQPFEGISSPLHDDMLLPPPYLPWPVTAILFQVTLLNTLDASPVTYPLSPHFCKVFIRIAILHYLSLLYQMERLFQVFSQTVSPPSIQKVFFSPGWASSFV